MSLVNDALQKLHAQTAQRQVASRASGVPGVPGVAGAVPYRFNKPKRNSSRGLWLVGAGFVFAGIVVVAVIAFVHRTPLPAPPPVLVAVPAALHSPTTQPVAVAVPPVAPAEPTITAPASAASGLASAASLPIAAAPATQPSSPNVTVPMEAAPVAATAVPPAPPATVPATTPLNTAAPAAVAAPVAAVIDLQSLNVPGLGKLKLTGIALSPFGTRAVINGTIISVGDQVGPATITDIQDKRVKLEIGGKAYTLSLP